MARSNRLSKNLTIIFFVIAFLLATFFPWAASVLADPMVQDDDAAAGESESQFFDQIDVDLVNLDVVVTDRKGQPVAGLTREDFDILIDGAPVELHNFFEVTGTAAEVETSGAAPLADAPDATPQASRPALSNRVIFVDNRNIRPENRKLLFDKLQDHLATDASPARTMLVTMGRKLEIAVPFTEESSRIAGTLDELARQAPLHAILDSERRMFISRLGNAPLHPYDPPESTNDILVSTPGSDAVGGSLEAARDPDFDDAVRRALNLATDVRRLAEKRYQHAQTTAAALGQFCETLGGMPGRKALIYLSDGIPMRPADSLIESFTGKFQNWIFTYGDDIRRNSSYPDADRTFQQVMNALASSEFDLSQEIRQLTSRASANRVAFYPISNSGGNAGFVSAAVSGATINEGSGSGLRNAQSSENFSRDASLLVMAEDTDPWKILPRFSIFPEERGFAQCVARHREPTACTHQALPCRCN
ncbi:MAG: VWA domain-containing protein [Acidobacteriota bacterium]